MTNPTYEQNSDNFPGNTIPGFNIMTFTLPPNAQLDGNTIIGTSGASDTLTVNADSTYALNSKIVVTAGAWTTPVIAIGTSSSTTPGSGAIVSAANPRVIDVHADDNDEAPAQGTMLSCARFRLARYASDSINESYAVHGLLRVIGTGSFGGWGAGVMGAVEPSGTVALAGQSTNIIAGVLGRFGTSETLNTNTSSDRVACMCAFNNNAVALSGSGKSVGMLVTESITGTPVDLDYGLEIGSGVARTAIYATATMGAITSEEHGFHFATTGTASSGDSLVGLNSTTTVAGTAASWACGLFINATQASKAVNGYICAAEFELNSTAANASDNSVIVINSIRNHTGSPPACDPYITLREYGTTYANALVRVFGDTGQGALNAIDSTKLVTQLSGGFEANCDCAIRIMVGSTPVWLLGTTTTAA